VIIDVGDGLIELINPEFVETKGVQREEEGCLSFPGKKAHVERPAYVKAKGLNRRGEEIFIEGTEIMAVALCHEIDHLEGVLFADRALTLEDEKDELEDEI